MKKQITFMYIDESTGKVKQKRVNRKGFYVFLTSTFLLILFSILTASGIYFIFSNKQQELSAYDYFKQQNLLLNEKLHRYEGMLNTLKKQVDEYDESTERIMALASLSDPSRNINAKPVQVSSPLSSLESRVPMGGFHQMSTVVDDPSQRAELLVEGAERLLSRAFDGIKNVNQNIEYFTRVQMILNSTPSLWPVSGWISSSFGFRYDPFTTKQRFHSGLDIAAEVGSPVIAPSDGYVRFSGREGDYGIVVIIDHGKGITTKFGHLERALCSIGDKVKREDVIGLVGNTGRTTGPHLHYEILINGIPVDPKKYIL